MGLGSGILEKPIPDPGSRIPDLGVKKAPDPGSRSATLSSGRKFLERLTAKGTSNPRVQCSSHFELCSNCCHLFTIEPVGATAPRLLDQNLVRLTGRAGTPISLLCPGQASPTPSFRCSPTSVRVKNACFKENLSHRRQSKN
jgi:hypothetical protein